MQNTFLPKLGHTCIITRFDHNLVLKIAWTSLTLGTVRQWTMDNGPCMTLVNYLSSNLILHRIICVKELLGPLSEPPNVKVTFKSSFHHNWVLKSQNALNGVILNPGLSKQHPLFSFFLNYKLST